MLLSQNEQFWLFLALNRFISIAYLFKTKFRPSFLLTLEYNGLKSDKAVCLPQKKGVL